MLPCRRARESLAVAWFHVVSDRYPAHGDPARCCCCGRDVAIRPSRPSGQIYVSAIECIRMGRCNRLRNCRSCRRSIDRGYRRRRRPRDPRRILARFGRRRYTSATSMDVQNTQGVYRRRRAPRLPALWINRRQLVESQFTSSLGLYTSHIALHTSDGRRASLDPHHTAHRSARCLRQIVLVVIYYMGLAFQ